MVAFTHLHVHSHYSVLDGMCKINDLISKCQANGMNAMALTDHGAMYGIKEFVDSVKKINGKIKNSLKEAKADLSKCEDENKKAELQKKIDELTAKEAAYIPFKAIIGVEAYCARRTLKDKDKTIKALDPETGRESTVDRSGYHLILLAKNYTGYKNLCKLVSISWIDGFYGKPRIDKNILSQYHEGLICCSACLGGEIPQHIIAGNMEEAEKSVQWFKNLFGDDYYIELQRHKTDKPNAETSFYERQKMVNPHLVELAHKFNIKIIATNDVHFVEEAHAEAHDRLICLSTGSEYDDPNRMHYSKQEWLKTPEEMATIFPDYPEALANTMEIAEKVEVFSIDSGPIMPKFPIPEEFGTEEEYRKKFTDKDLFDEFTRDENGNVVLSQEDAEKKIKTIGGYEKLYRIKLEADYLNKITWEGAQKRYGENLDKAIDAENNPIPPDKVKERINFELYIMKSMGFPGYFLIVQDYIRGAREELDIWVGPGRGSAAGSVVAYCLWITNVDPLRYDLLFERFLNPDRISLPDIDVDFEDCRRGDVLNWVTERYGYDHVAHIITYGTMATKSSIKDLCRIQRVPLEKSIELTKYVPDKEFADDVPKNEKGKKPKVNLKNCFKYINELKEARYGDDINLSQTLSYAEDLEDTIRQTGIHACGVIIGADELAKFAPMATIKDRVSGNDVIVTQYDGHYVESVGLIKMDFLGLSTLTLQREALRNIKKRHNIDIDIEAIPIDDELTYKLFSDGHTVGIFQFESPGMQKHLKDLKPTVITDLIAMNALYRPGPIEYIPNFIKRKHGEEPIVYDIPIMDKYLKDTYGVTVYQEQVMLLSRQLAGFTRGESDMLRKAMGKKLITILEGLKKKFIEGGQANGHDPQILETIWKKWEAFASYAFNKSHSTCYAWVAYQTGYLKAHYPEEYMAACLTLNKDDIKEIQKFMEECKSMQIAVKGPDINESELNFTVNNKGEVLFGMSGVKGVGEGAVYAIIKERNANGPFKSIYDFVERVDLSTCNRKTIEALALAGAFDSFEDFSREQLFCINGQGRTGAEIMTSYGSKFQSGKSQYSNSLFGEEFITSSITRPELPVVDVPWSSLERLNKEKQLVGIYLSAHPLDAYKFEMRYIVNAKVDSITKDNYPNFKGKQITIAGIITNVRNGLTKRDKPYICITLEDAESKNEFFFHEEDIKRYGNILILNTYIYITITVSPSRYNPNELRLYYMSVGFLSDLLVYRHFNTAVLKINIENLNSFLTDDIDNFLSSENEKIIKLRESDVNDNEKIDKKIVPLKFMLIDSSHNREVMLNSLKEYKTLLGASLLEFIDRNNEIELALA